MIPPGEEATRRFMDRMVHDLQEGLRSVAIATELLMHGGGSMTDDQNRRLWEEILSGASRLRIVIDGVSEYASALRQPAQTPPAPLDIGLRTALAKLESDVRMLGARITSDELPRVALPMDVSASLFRHLIGNALKFRSSETPCVHISADRQESEWIVSVEDNGLGIDSRSLDTVFDPFTRLNGRRYPGAGLGLAICRRLIESYNGRIWVEKAPGGSRFCFAVPALS